MTVRHLQSGDERELLVLQVFSQLCQSALEEGQNGLTVEQRLWRLPEMATNFVYNVVTDEDNRRVEPIVHRLRLQAGELINRRLDRKAAKRAIAERLEDARRELTLRPWNSNDAALMSSLLDNRKLWEGLPDEYPGQVTVDLAHQLIEISNEWSDRHVVRAVEWRRQVVGQVRLQFDSSPYADDAEISYWVGEPYWGQGLGTRIVTLFTADSFSQRPGLQRLFAQVLEENKVSMRVLEKSGYRYESFRYQSVTKDGAKRSTHIFGVCRADYTLP